MLPPPVALRIPSDLPLAELAARLPAARRPVWLDSSSPAGRAGRWSLLAFDPERVLEHRAADEPVADGARGLARLEALLDEAFPGRDERGSGGDDRGPGRDGRRHGTAGAVRGPGAGPADVCADDGGPLPAFRGGAVALLGYDLARELERLPHSSPRDAELPDLWAGVYPVVVADEHASGRRLVLGRVPVARLRGVADELAQLARAPRPALGPLRVGAPRSTFEQAAYEAAVERARHHVREGDVYQVNLSQRFAFEGRVDALRLHDALRRASPVPYGALLRTPGFALVSGSPERFLARRGARVSSWPIKGTRPRGRDAADDARLRAELEASSKESAELSMIVDLVRNDLSRSAAVGSVSVQLPFDTERWSTVFHRVARVSATLAPGTTSRRLVEAAWPPASVTGTPKISACALIERLEPVRRHAYTGALGWFDAAGDLELSVLIRIATLVDERLLVPVGGGITLASEPRAEWQETLHKARALFGVLGVPLPGARHLETRA